MPGWLTSPNTKTRIERRAPRVILALTPIICSDILELSNAFNSLKVKPETAIGPIRGKLTTPSRLTVKVSSKFSVPNSNILISSPGPTIYSFGMGILFTGAKVLGAWSNRE